jgi:hypothetical protein
MQMSDKDGEKSYKAICLMSRTDFGSLKEHIKEEVYAFHYAFQDAAYNVRLVSTSDGTTIEILAYNIFVAEAQKCLWSGIHNLINPDSQAYIEIRDHDFNGMLLDYEQYIVDDIVLSKVVDMDNGDLPQVIKITGLVTQEIHTVDEVPEGLPKSKE